MIFNISILESLDSPPQLIQLVLFFPSILSHSQYFLPLSLNESGTHSHTLPTPPTLLHRSNSALLLGAYWALHFGFYVLLNNNETVITMSANSRA